MIGDESGIRDAWAGELQLLQGELQHKFVIAPVRLLALAAMMGGGGVFENCVSPPPIGLHGVIVVMPPISLAWVGSATSLSAV